MPASDPPCVVAAVRLLGCELDDTGLTKSVRLQTADGGELVLLLPVAVAGDLRASLDESLRVADLPPLKPFRDG